MAGQAKEDSVKDAIISERGLWTGSATDRAIRMWERDESKIKLPWTKRADGMRLTTPLV